LPEECRTIGRVYFAKAPDSQLLVAFADLPPDTVSAVWNKDVISEESFEAAKVACMMAEVERRVAGAQKATTFKAASKDGVDRTELAQAMITETLVGDV
jgi:hypothetical protein